MATQSNSITNRIIIRADSQNSDSPKNAQTSREISLKSHDDIEFAITLAKSGESISAAAVAKVCVEIFDIGARNAPSPRSVKLLFSKSTENISDISDTCPFNAIIEVAAEENAFDAGSKWIRVCAFSPEGKRTTFTQGWINIEESFGDSPSAETEIVQSFLKTEDAKSIFLQKNKNLSDLLDKAAALENLGALSASETLQSIESACAQKADTTHEHSEYLKKSDAQNLYASAESTELSLNEIESEISTLENNITSTENSIAAVENKVLDSRLSKLSAGALYFNSGKLSGSNFAVPNFPFSICATVRIDAWRGANENSQPIFQYGELGSGTGSTFAIAFIDGENDPKLRLRIVDTVDGANKSTFVESALALSSFLGKMHTIIGICRAVTAEALNWDIYIDGAKQNIASSAKNAIVSSLSGTRAWAVNTSNDNFSSQPASANPMMLRNLYIFNFDVSAEGSPYSIADYEAGRLIPPALKPSQVSLALENYTIERNATTTLVKDASGNSNDATVKGNVAGDNDQSIKVFVDEIKTQINQSNG